MKTATVSEFRAKMREHLDDVEKDQDVLILSGPKKKDFVVITLDQYNSMEETAHLLSTPANAQHLMESISQDKAGIVAHAFNLDPHGTHKKVSYKKAGGVVGKKSSGKQGNLLSNRRKPK